MLTDVLKVLELLVNTIKGHLTPERKRQKLAKDLLRVYLDTDDVVQRGRELLSLVGPEKLVAAINLDALLAQQAALRNLDEHLRPVAPILKLHLPVQAERLMVFHGAKDNCILLLVASLLGRTPRRSYLEHSDPVQMQRLFDEYKAAGEDVLWKNFEREPMPLSSDKSWWVRPGEDKYFPVLATTPSDLQAARKTLDEIAAIGEQLRLFLIDKFKLEELI